jgi:PLP dependent protein
MPPLTPLCCSYATNAQGGLERLDLAINMLYFIKTMSDSSPYGALATALAGLQQRLRTTRPEGFAAPILIGASKSQPIATLEAAINLGLQDFGENKVQEAQSKWPALKQRYPDVRLHLIGPLQSNKAADAVALFDVIHTIDRAKIADALASACAKMGKSPMFLIQVNTGEEPQKAGVAPRDVAALLAHCQHIGLPISGLMCVPPDGVNPAPHFALLKKMANDLGLRELSMGMSGDYETALRLGSTMIRVGTALFGSRA